MRKSVIARHCLTSSGPSKMVVFGWFLDHQHVAHSSLWLSVDMWNSNVSAMRYSPAVQIPADQTSNREVMQKKLIDCPISNHDPVSYVDTIQSDHQLTNSPVSVTFRKNAIVIPNPEVSDQCRSKGTTHHQWASGQLGIARRAGGEVLHSKWQKQPTRSHMERQFWISVAISSFRYAKQCLKNPLIMLPSRTD